MKSTISLSTAGLLALRFLGASALPDVNPVSLGSTSCYYWPNWQNVRGTDITGGFFIQVDVADETAVEGFYAQRTTFSSSSGTVDQTTLNLRAASGFPRTLFRCYNANLQYYSGATNMYIGKDMRYAVMQPAAGYSIEPYAHEIDGVRQPGVFLGALNQTTWGFRYVKPDVCGQLDYYEVKLLNLPIDPETPPTAQYPYEFTGFLKAIAA